MNDKLWLLIDSVHKKLLRARLWTTSLDDYKKDIEDAIKALEEAKENWRKNEKIYVGEAYQWKKDYDKKNHIFTRWKRTKQAITQHTSLLEI